MATTTAPTKPTPAGPADDVRRIALHQLDSNPDNPRTLPGVDLRDLAASIASVGLLEPLVVRPAEGNDPGDPASHRFTIVAGHRRAAALQLLHEDPTLDGVTDPAARPDVELGPLCVVRSDVTADSRVLALVENLQRVDLTPLEEARAISDLVAAGMTQKDVAAAIGRNQGHVSKRLTLLKATPDLAALIDAGRVPLDVAVDLAKLPTVIQDDATERLEAGADADMVRRRAIGQVTDLRDRGRAIKAARTALADAGLPTASLQELAVGDYQPVINRTTGPAPLTGYAAGPIDAAHAAAGTDLTTQPPCTTWYVRGVRAHVAVEPDLTWDGYDSAWISGPFCCDPASHADATTTDEPNPAQADRPTNPTQPSPEQVSRAQEMQSIREYVAALTVARRQFINRLVRGRLPKNTDRILADFATLAVITSGAAVYDAEVDAHELADTLGHPTGEALDATALLITPDLDTTRRTGLAAALTTLSSLAERPIRDLALGYPADGSALWISARILTTLTDLGYDLNDRERAVIDAATIPALLTELDLPEQDPGEAVDPDAEPNTDASTDDTTPAAEAPAADDATRSAAEHARAVVVEPASRRPQLLEAAAMVGVATSPKMTKAQIVAAVLEVTDPVVSA